MNKIIKFISLVYLFAWPIQIAVSLYYNSNKNKFGTIVFQIGALITMFTPMLSTFIVKGNLNNMGWKPLLKSNIKWILFAIFIPLILIILGALLFFIIYPDLLDFNGTYIIKEYEKMNIDILKQIESKGLNFKTFLLIQFISNIFYAPIINSFPSAGEESGWRGFIYPELKAKYGKIKGWIIGGIIWSSFHFPLILISGFNYGKEYIGSPLSIFVFTLFCIFIGIIEDFIYLKTNSIWFPSLLHGSINAFSSFTPVITKYSIKSDKLKILGPMPYSLIGMIPTIIFTIIITITFKNEKEKIN